jgi:hypothetical protein
MQGPSPSLPPLPPPPTDPDMLGVGMPGITDTEGRTQFSLWCILGAPLFLGTDVRTASAATLETIGNVEAIAINQDALGIQGYALTSGPAPTPYQGGLLVNVSECAAAAAAGGASAQWRLTADGHLQSADASGTCATVYACGTAPGSLVFGYGCTTNECGNQLWNWTGPAAGGQLVSAALGMQGRLCLAAVAAQGDSGGQLSLQVCSSSDPLQTWALQGGEGGSSSPLALPRLPVPRCAYFPAPPAVSVYAKPLSPEAGGQPVALAVLNRGSASVPGQVVSLEALGFAPAQAVVVRDVWAGSTSAAVAGNFTTREVGSHETLLLKITPVER